MENQKIVYPFLPKGRTIKYVPADNLFMRAAEEMRNTVSTDLYFPTGAVVVKDGVIVGKGANQSLLRTQWLLRAHQQWACIRRLFSVPSGKKYWMCPGCAPSSQHAETRACVDAAKHTKTQDADLYLFGHWWCCEPCWNSIIQAGIKDVYLLEGSERLFDKNHPDNIIGKR
jgi:deoxycytidylate deaminase